MIKNLPASRSPIANKLLASLPPGEFQRLLTHLEPVTLSFGEVLYESGGPVKHVYFPNNSLISLLRIVDNHLALEVGMAGNEGMVGFSHTLGIDTAPFLAIVQGSGMAMRMKAATFRREFHQNAALQKQVHLYINALMAQIAQTAACNRFHVIEARLAKWLLMTRDRVGSNHFRLTQEFLGHMLGVRRVGVSNAAAALKRRHLIDYSRGELSIIDGSGLETASCSCYLASKPGGKKKAQ